AGLYGTLVAFDAEDLTKRAVVAIAPGVEVEVHAQTVSIDQETLNAEQADEDADEDQYDDEYDEDVVDDDADSEGTDPDVALDEQDGAVVADEADEAAASPNEDYGDDQARN